MKICLIGPGIMPIPPPAWGAVEIIIWDYYTALSKSGHQVTIINIPDQQEIIRRVNMDQYDFVHCHYDVFWPILKHLKTPMIAITSHYPYIDQLDKHAADGYTPIFHFLTHQTQYYNFALADKDIDILLEHGANRDRIFRFKNGIQVSQFHWTPRPKYMKSIYLGKITPRKGQARYQHLPDIDFVGQSHDPLFNSSNHLGEWTRDQIHENLTNYVNLVLLSFGECDPLVVKEAMAAGLGIVVNRTSAENLPRDCPFITIIDDEMMDDFGYVSRMVEENRQISVNMREQIRELAIQNFDIQHIIDTEYIPLIHTVLPPTTHTTSDTTLVTCYFQLEISKASREKYMGWMHNMLIIKKPMVIFCDNASKEYIMQMRQGLPTKMVIMDWQDFYVYQHWGQVFVDQVPMDPERYIGHCPELYMIWNEKSHFLWRAMQMCDTPYFLWVDIGCFRETNTRFLDWPNPEKMLALPRKQVLLLEVIPFTQSELATDNILYLPDFLRVNHIGGTIFGGHRDALEIWHEKYYEMLQHFVNVGKFIGKDQSIMNSVYLIHRDLCNLVKTDKNCGHDEWFYFQPYLN